MHTLLSGKIDGIANPTSVGMRSQKLDFDLFLGEDRRFHKHRGWLSETGTSRALMGDVGPGELSEPVEPVPAGDFIADPDARMHYFAVDRGAKLAGDKSPFECFDVKAHIVELIPASADEAFKSHLRSVAGNGLSGKYGSPGDTGKSRLRVRASCQKRAPLAGGRHLPGTSSTRDPKQDSRKGRGSDTQPEGRDESTRARRRESGRGLELHRQHHAGDCRARTRSHTAHQSVDPDRQTGHRIGHLGHDESGNGSVIHRESGQGEHAGDDDLPYFTVPSHRDEIFDHRGHRTGHCSHTSPLSIGDGRGEGCDGHHSEGTGYQGHARPQDTQTQTGFSAGRQLKKLQERDLLDEESEAEGDRTEADHQQRELRHDAQMDQWVTRAQLVVSPEEEYNEPRYLLSSPNIRQDRKGSLA
ncbi:hypothetical protein [Brevibacterium marinum]|uniref:Uncharacterized protein n=1 Tax=Brevibacterium marinum TaxID=418643 RepID=A0A846S3D1_9MICO|nr:hypothetical protein [Brevibacterium marinum]NJC56042.1 hypothetical protein [Brevibacterium marinum]